MPRISVVLASYNHECFVQETIHSVLNQDYEDFELIVTDDASSDATVDRIREIRDPRIRLFCFARNRGACVAHNHCIKQAQGEYIAMINSDDVCCPGRLSKQVEFLDNHPEIGAVFGLPLIINESGKEGKDKRHNRTRQTFTAHLQEKENRTRYEWLHFFFYNGNCLCHPSVMIRRECHEDVGLYDERYAQLPDFDFWIRLSLKYDIHILPEYLVKFRVFSDKRNASGSTPEKVIRRYWENRQILRNFLNIRDKETLLRVFPEAREYGDDYDDALIPFVIAKLALGLPSRYPSAKDFGLDTIGSLLSNRMLAEQLERTFKFTYMDFIKMTGTYDVYSYGLMHNIKKHAIKYLFGLR